jgi:hypothetical protein
MEMAEQGELTKCTLCIVRLHLELFQKAHAFVVEKVIRWKNRQDSEELCLVKGWGLEHEKKS